MNPRPAPRLSAADTTLVVVDVQEKLLAKMPEAAWLVRNVAFLLDVAGLLGVPARGTEQYPKGLGPTHPDLARRLTHELPAKTAFSAFGAPGFSKELRDLARPNIVLTGMESHVCIAQTALDLLDAGMPVFMPVDAVSSRFVIDHETALRRLEKAGVVLTTVEAVAFEWLGDANHERFKAVSQLVIARSQG